MLDRRMMVAGAGGALGSLDTALNVAFPDLVDGLGITVADLQWVVVSYVLSYGGLLLAAGQWGDRFGHRRMLVAGAAGSAAAMVGCALAPSFGWFLIARVGQGVAAALVMAAAPA
ncbi:MAG: MFS transporter, partial [Acidimicrobiales bacterium]